MVKTVFCVFAAVLVSVVNFGVTARAAMPLLDGPEGRSLYSAAAHARLKEGNFPLLEKIANEARVTKARFLDGTWQLSAFYHGVSEIDPRTSLEQAMQLMDQWKAAYPNSITEEVTRAEILTGYAWQARGSGYANTITPEGGRLFEDRLAQARKVLEQAQKLPDKCPQWNAAMLTVALGQGWERSEYEQFFAGAVKFEPAYYDYYFLKANWLLPKWYGRTGDWEAFAAEAAKDDPQDGMSVYARVAWANASEYQDLFKNSAIQWPAMKQGFMDLNKNFPDSTWNLNNFCKFAVMAKDRATVQMLLKRIGDHPNLSAWDSRAFFQEVKREYLGTGAPATKPLMTLLFANGGKAKGLAYSPDGNVLAAGYGSGEVVVWDAATGKQLQTLSCFDDDIRGLAFSPDGKRLAAGCGGVYADAPGKVVVWDTATWKEQAPIPATYGPVGSVAFSADGKSLFTTGGLWKKAEVMICDPATGIVSHIDTLEKHTHTLWSLALSPDGKTMAMECNNKTAVLWDLEKSQYIFPGNPKQKTLVSSVAFSPDGKMLALGCAPSWQKPNDPGDVALYDVPAAHDAPALPAHQPALKADTGGIFSVSFSPDGKRLAAGGTDRCVRVWDIATGRETSETFGHEGTINKVVFSPDGKSLASSADDGAVKIWDAKKL